MSDCHEDARSEADPPAPPRRAPPPALVAGWDDDELIAPVSARLQPAPPADAPPERPAAQAPPPASDAADPFAEDPFEASPDVPPPAPVPVQPEDPFASAVRREEPAASEPEADPFAEDPFADGLSVPTPEPTPLEKDPFASAAARATEATGEEPEAAIAQAPDEDAEPPAAQEQADGEAAAEARVSPGEDPFAEDPFAEAAEDIPVPTPAELPADPFESAAARAARGEAPDLPPAEEAESPQREPSPEEREGVPAPAGALDPAAVVAAPPAFGDDDDDDLVVVPEALVHKAPAPIPGPAPADDPFAKDPFAAQPIATPDPKPLAHDPFADAAPAPAPPRRQRTPTPRDPIPLPAPAQHAASASASASRSSAEELVPLRREQPVAVVGFLGLVVVAAVGWGGLNWIQTRQFEAEKARFVAELGELAPKDALWASRALSEAVRQDPEIAARLSELEEQVAEAEARERATVALGRLSPKLGLQARLERATAALEAHAGFAPAYLVRAQASHRLARRAAHPAEADLRAMARDPLADLNQAIHHDPQFAAAYCERAGILLELGQEQPALVALEQAASHDDGGAWPLVARGQRSLVQGDAEEARAHFERALGRDPELGAARVGLARACLTLGDLVQAREAAARAQVDALRGATASVLRAEACWLGGESTGEILIHLRRAQSLDPLAARAYALESWLLIERAPDGSARSEGAWAAAVAGAAAKALALDPRQALAHTAQAELAWARGERAAAGAALREAFAVGNGRDLLGALVLRARTRGADDSALEDLRQALALDPEHGPALALQGELLCRFRAYADARVALDAALLRRPEFTRGYELRAICCLEGERTDLRQALRDLGVVLERRPGAVEALQLRARAYHALGLHRDALNDLDACGGVERSLHSDRLAWLRASCHYALGEWAPAREAYAAYVRLNPDGNKARQARTRLSECEERLSNGSSDY